MTEVRRDLKYTVRMQQREEQQRVNAETTLEQQSRC